MIIEPNEAALEKYNENAPAKGGYYAGNSADLDRKLAINGKRFWQFLEVTQSKEYK